MTKAIFYDSIGGWMHKCMFAGLDKEGRAQWMMVDQGAEVMMLDDYLDIGEVCGELNLLCLMGEEVESSTMALLLGAVVQSYGPDIPSQLSYCLERLKKWDVSWLHDPLEMEVRPLEYLDEASQQKMFRFYIRCKNVGFVTEADCFETMNGLMDYVRQYFDALEMGAGIPMTAKFLSADKELLAKVSKVDLEMFDW